MTIPIYFEERILLLTDDLENEINSEFDALHQFTSYGELKQFIQKFQSNQALKRGILYGCNSLGELMKQFKACFKYIEAAGGVVFSSAQEVLVIYRRGKWDLPKGKCEHGETPEETAVREVKEECGLKTCSIISRLTETYHTYTEKQRHCLKKTHWFKMATPYKDTVPQAEEDIKRVEWIRKSDFDTIQKNTWFSVNEVLRLIE